VPPLVWFGDHWTVIGNDAGRYLLAASKLVLGQGLANLNPGSHINHGPGFPALIGALILIFGRDTEELAWAVRLIAQLNPLLAYFLTKRISGPVAGLIAAAVVTLFGYTVKATSAFNIDAVLLMYYLLALLALLAAIKRNSSLLALLSGLLLGASILIKETAFANLPLALLAVLLLDWDLRRALWHYLGVAFVCLPWWIWAYSATGEVYLVDRLPVSLQVPVVMVTMIFLGIAAGAYTSGIIDRFLADERRRRWTGRFVVVAWTVLLTTMLLATASPALARLSFETLRRYLAWLLAPNLVVVPVLLLVSGYVIWKAFTRRSAPWRLLALALLFQVPVCLLVTVEGWAPRQFLIPQTLLFCALAALVVDASEAVLRGRGGSGRIVGAVVALPLVILLVVSSVERVRVLLPENFDGLSAQRRVAPQATEMIDWMAENIPEGKNIIVNAAQANYLIFLDGGQHEWTQLRLDQGICVPRPNAQMRCNPQENDISRTPPDAIWVQMMAEMGECRAISLSMPTLLEQVRREDSGYVMISGSSKYPGLLKLPSRLEDSNAFEIVHTELDHEGESSANQGIVLLKSTGQTPRAVPTQMDAKTMLRLKRCEQAKGPGYEKRIESKFPNGIVVVSG
jgi:4-amino-4-deoxy-L-arabinose transferase-like glycosyltransferase